MIILKSRLCFKHWMLNLTAMLLEQCFAITVKGVDLEQNCKQTMGINLVASLSINKRKQSRKMERSVTNMFVMIATGSVIPPLVLYALNYPQT